MNRSHQLTDMIHTIFCRRPHEEDLAKFESSEKCCYLVEESLEDTWNLRHHKEWIEQSEFFRSIAKGREIEALQIIVSLHQKASELKTINKLLLRYVTALLEDL